MTPAFAGLLFLAGILAHAAYERLMCAVLNRGSVSDERAAVRREIWLDWYIVATGRRHHQPEPMPPLYSNADLEHHWSTVQELFADVHEARQRNADEPHPWELRRPVAADQRNAKLRALPSPPEGRHALPEQPPRLALARGPR